MPVGATLYALAITSPLKPITPIESWSSLLEYVPQLSPDRYVKVLPGSILSFGIIYSLVLRIVFQDPLGVLNFECTLKLELEQLKMTLLEVLECADVKPPTVYVWGELQFFTLHGTTFCLDSRAREIVRDTHTLHYTIKGSNL
jgi:hypothetical protein